MSLPAGALVSSVGDTRPSPSRLLRGAAVLRDPLVRELLAERLVAVLGTVGPDGAPHLTPVWFADAGDAIVIATGAVSRKVEPRGRRARRARPPPLAGGVRGLRRLNREAVIVVAGPEPCRSSTASTALRLAGAWTWDQRGTPADRVLRASGGAIPLAPTSPRASAEP